MQKIEVQHNMFIELFPRELFRYEREPILLRKLNIKQCYIKHFREDCMFNDRDREPFHVITVEMVNGDKYEEYYENFTNYGLMYSMKEIKELAIDRYEYIKQQLCEV